MEPFIVLLTLCAADVEAANNTIERRLDQPVNVEFVNAPLKDVVEDFRILTGLELVLDEAALEEAGIDLDRPCSIRLEGVSFRSTLALILHQASLVLVVDDGVPLITTERRRAGWIVQRSYTVSDLVMSPDEEEPGWGCVSAESRDTLLRLITSTIAPQSWAEADGTGQIHHNAADNSLSITQSMEVHQEVRALLDALRCPGPEGETYKLLPYLSRRFVAREPDLHSTGVGETVYDDQPLPW